MSTALGLLDRRIVGESVSYTTLVSESRSKHAREADKATSSGEKQPLAVSSGLDL